MVFKMNKNKIRSRFIMSKPFCRCLLYVFMIIFFMYGISFAASVKTVLVVSIDALHPDALSPETSKNIYRLMQQGSYTLDGHSTHPPKTLVSHAAMFSGLSPEKGGRKNNSWHTGELQIKGKTIFNTAKSLGFSTGFFYSKEKLGFLVNPAVDQYKLDKDFSVDNAVNFLKTADKKAFCFLHVSGLDITGPIEGWLSPGYMEELFYIDDAIAPLIRLVESKENYLIIITSDHAGHGTIHGSDHPDDEKLPFIMISDSVDSSPYQGITWHVADMKPFLDKILK